MGPPAPRQTRHLWLQKGINANLSEKRRPCAAYNTEWQTVYTRFCSFGQIKVLEQMNELQRYD
jgi:hypothetical protein